MTLLLVEDAERVRTLTFNRPDRANAFSEPLYREVAAALRAAATDDGIGAVVLTGAGKNFCAGTDLHEMAAMVPGIGTAEPRTEPGTEAPFAVYFEAITTFPKPLLAAVNGAGIGLGFTMLAHCDLVIVAESARLLAPFTTMGVAPEMASSYLFPRRMGRQRAAEILYTAEWVSASAAVDAGIALRMVPAERLLPETLALARAIAAKPLASLLATKRLITEAERDGVLRAQAAESEAFGELLSRPSAEAGILGQLD